MTSSGDSTELDDWSGLAAKEGASHALADPRPALRGAVAPEARPAGDQDPQGPADDSGDQASGPGGTPPQSPRRWIRPALFLLLPILLIAGGYWFVTGGQVTSMDDA